MSVTGDGGENRPPFSISASSIGANSSSMFQPLVPPNPLFPTSSGIVFSSADSTVVLETGLFNPSASSFSSSAANESVDMNLFSSSVNTDAKSSFQYSEPRLTHREQGPSKKRKLNPIIGGGSVGLEIEIPEDVSSNDSHSPHSSSPEDYV